ncbi:hypothetical protein HOY82DRAFT_548012, partial [Tuber indicum]
MNGLTGQYQDITKAPDISIAPRGSLLPAIVLELGFAKPYKDLKANAELLLKGSKGAIGKVIVIKLDPLYEGETQIQKGFV